MNDLIKFHYNIECENIKEEKGCYNFTTNGITFLLCPFLRSEEELRDLYQICEELKQMQIPVETFILNREGKLVTNLYEKNYILCKNEQNPNKEYNILDMIEMMNNLHLSEVKSKLYRNQWSELWSKKIDYFEYQIHELGKEKKVILNSFTYYVGLAENAISYINNALKKETKLSKITLCHKRVYFPNLSEDYLNPCTFIFDLPERDIAEYIKSAFFVNEEEAWIELKALLRMKNQSFFNYTLFYGRLLYPSYYFDVYEQIMNNEEQEEKLLPYIKKAPEYEVFLKKVYLEITKIFPMEPIEWILKKK